MGSPDAPCSVTKPVAGSFTASVPQQKLEAIAPTAAEFFTQGRAGHAVPMAPGHSGYSQRDPQNPSPLRGTNARPPFLLKLWGWGGGVIKQSE